METPGSPNRSSSAAPLPESCRARFGERERLRDDDDEWRRFFFFFSFFWRFFSFFMAFLSAFFLRRLASSSLIDETLLELEREGMVACFAWGRRCAAGSFWAYAACAAIRANGSAHARGRGVWGWHCRRQFRTAPADTWEARERRSS